MRKTVYVVLVSLLVVGLMVPTASAEPKPTTIPHQVNPGEEGFTAAFGGASFTDLWEELEGVGAELPQTGGGGFPVPAQPPSEVSTAVLRPVSTDDYIRGPVPIGFTFHHMDGPVEPAPGWPPADWQEWWTGPTAPPLPENWPSALTGAGYTEVYVSTNGFIVFRDRSHRDDPDFVSANCLFQDCEQPDLGAWNWYPWQVPIAEPPNNFVAPYWTDLAVGDNSYFKMAKGCAEVDPTFVGDLITAPNNGSNGLCMRQLVTRPRGRLLFATLGTAPNRKFVVEWLNARNHWTGFLTTFELQLFEGSNAILFLYKDFQAKDEGQAYFDIPSVVIGMEDWFGTTGVGQAYLIAGGRSPWNLANYTARADMLDVPKWVLDFAGIAYGHDRLVPPMANGDMLGFVY